MDRVVQSSERTCQGLEHAETVRRRCPSEGDMWVNQPQSWDPLAEGGSGLNQEMLRPRGHRPSGREHERALF